MFDPLTIGVSALVWLAFRKRSDSQFGQLTPEREEVYRNAMEFGDPQRLVEFSRDFDKFGLKTQALLMRERAKWRSRSPEQKNEHDAIFAKALQSNNPEAILEIANIFHSMTATVKANQLRERVKSLRAVKTTAEESMPGHTHSKDKDDGLPKNSTAAE